MLMSFIPFIFYLSKDNKFDQFIGNLSYPIYLLWGLRIDLTPKIMSWIGSQNPDIEGLVRYSLVTIMAIAIYLIIEKPIERIRDRFKVHTLKPLP
jgi:peptidoglycan/LPS O-acetylase OafA/YrhL